MNITNFPVGLAAFALPDLLSLFLRTPEHLSPSLDVLFTRINSSLTSRVWSWTFKAGRAQRTFTSVEDTLSGDGFFGSQSSFKRNRVTFDLGQGLCFIEVVTLRLGMGVLVCDREEPSDLFEIPPATVVQLLKALDALLELVYWGEEISREDPDFSFLSVVTKFLAEEDLVFPPSSGK